MNPSVKSKIIDIAYANPQEEICGFICYDDSGKPVVIQCDNISNNKKYHFLIDPHRFVELSSIYNIYGIFHSHVSDSINFSENDTILSENLTIPIYLYNVKNNVWKDYWPRTLSFELLGNPFCYGLFDCFNLVRIYYWKILEILLGDYDVDDVILRNNNMVLDNFEREGFIKIDSTAVERKHDIIVTKNFDGKPNHLVIFDGKKYIDHKRGCLSSTIDLSLNFIKSKYMILRHKNLV